MSNIENSNTGDWNTGRFNAGDFNTGDFNVGNFNNNNFNTGDFNTGSHNNGDFNTGDTNTGGHNSGNFNSGSWNKSNYHVGCFNTTTAKKAYYFNVLMDKKDWDNAYKPDWLYKPLPTTWICKHDMTEKEKADNPTYVTCGGYLRKNCMFEEWKKAYNSASQEDIQKVRDLPNFDVEIFKEITGLDLSVKQNDYNNKIVKIDGVSYTLHRV
jgi:hypothetical protein